MNLKTFTATQIASILRSMAVGNNPFAGGRR
jgi:hypothetical protein